MFPYLFLYSLKHFGNRQEVHGSRFGQNVRSSKNHLKSIAIDQESLISHFGIIKTQKIPYNIIKNTRKNNKKRLNYFPPFPPLEPHWSPIGIGAIFSYAFQDVLQDPKRGSIGSFLLNGVVMNPCVGSNLNGLPWIQGLKGPKNGVYRPQNTAKMKTFFLCFLGLLMQLWGLQRV